METQARIEKESSLVRTWFITGTSRGLGAAMASHALRQGDNVVATARNPEAVRAKIGAHDRLLVDTLDVTDHAAAPRVVQHALDRFGSLDVLVNNAGRGLVGAVEETPQADVRAVFETNVFGPLSVIRAVLPTMRAQGSGRIVNISSVCGIAGAAGWGAYSATKFAVEGLSDALEDEVASFGIRVIVVQPGAFRTDFLDPSSLVHAGDRMPDYARTRAGVARAWTGPANHRQPGDPSKAAAAIWTAVTADQPPRRLPLGPDAVRAAEARTRSVSDELARWRDVAMDTEHG